MWRHKRRRRRRRDAVGVWTDISAGASGSMSSRAKAWPGFNRGYGSIERDADPLVAAPDPVAAADELIGFDQERERRRQFDFAGNLDRGAGRRDVANRAGD